MNLPDIRIIIIATAITLAGTAIYYECNHMITDQVYKVVSVEDQGKYYQIEAGMYLDYEGNRIEYNDNFSMPFERRVKSVHFRIPSDEYRPVPGEYIHVKRKIVFNRVKVLEVERIDLTDSVFGLPTLDLQR